MRSLSCTESELRQVLGPAGNKARTMDSSKQVLKPQRKVEKPQEIDEEKAKKALSLLTPSPPQSPGTRRFTVPSILRQQSNLSLNASCSSEASSDSSQSRASTGRMSRRSATPTLTRRKRFPTTEKGEKMVVGVDCGSAASDDSLPAKKRCAWVTPNTGMFAICSHTTISVIAYLCMWSV